MTIQAPPALVLVAGPPDGCLEIGFHHQTDRFAHRVSYLTQKDRQLLLQSVEGSATDHWPESPPLQQCHRQRLPDGRDAIFAVGQAGRGHWSLVAACQREVPAISIEIACRIPQSAGDLATATLGGTYRVSTPWQRLSDHGAAHEDQDWRCRLQITPGDESCQLQWTAEALRLDVSRPPQNDQAMTRIWKYQVCLEPKSGH